MPSGSAAHRRRFRTTLWLSLAALLSVLLLPALFRRGMHWDGVVYGTIARNMAAGEGDAWHPRLTPTLLAEFREHPPLGLWLESLAFRLLGDHFWVERVFGLVTLIVTLGLLVTIWRELLANRPRAVACCWLPLALWSPWGVWSFRNNMLESTMGVFTALAVYALLRACNRSRQSTLWTALAGAAVAAAVLTKGPAGLFPLVTPLAAFVALRGLQGSRCAGVQAGVLAATAGTLILVFCSADARNYLGEYWQQQVLSSLRGEREQVRGWFGQLSVLVWLARCLAIPVSIGLGLMFGARSRLGAWPADPRLAGPRRFCLLMALAASLPLALSPKQTGHYALGSWPFYAFAVALWCLPALLAFSRSAEATVSPKRLRWLQALAGATVACALVVGLCGYGRCYKDEQVITASDRVAAAAAPSGAVVADSADWGRLSAADRLKLHVYLYRRHRVALWADEPEPSFGLEQFRLRRPAGRLVRSRQPIDTPLGVACYPLLPEPRDSTVAALSVDVR